MEQGKIIATTNDSRSASGSAEIREFSSREVLVKSLQKIFLYWGLAVFSVFLPVVHFVLVPLFFVLGIVVSMRAFKFRHEMISGEVPCPRCGSKLSINHAVFNQTLKEICQNCAVEVRIEPSGKDAANLEKA